MKTSTELTQRLKTGVAPTRFHCQATGVGQTRAASEATGRARAVRAGTLTLEQAWAHARQPRGAGQGVLSTVSKQDIKAAGADVAPRVTPAAIEAEIASEHYFTAADAARFAWLTEDHSDPARFAWLTEDHSDPAQREAVTGIAGRIRISGYGSICQDIDANSNGVVSPQLRLLTFCVLVMRNGFTVTGESACASPENFNAEIGRRVARENAVQKIWPLMGYELRSKLAAA